MSLNILATVTNICLQNPAVSASLFQDDPLYEKDTQMRINKLINPKIAAAFTESVYYGVRESGCGLTEEEFQKQLFKLRDREYKYYYEMKKDQLPRIPDLSDMSGGLSNPAYFNFVSYVAWKVVSGQIKDAKTRNQIVQLSGINLLNKIAPDVLDQVKSKNYSLGSPMPIILLQNLIEQILDKLTNSGYLLQYKITWGYLPGSFSGDWYLNPEQEKYGSIEDQFNQFQIRIHQPADIEASVALREEDDGFWGAAVSSMLNYLIQLGGYQNVKVDEYFFQDAWKAPPSSWDKVKLFFGDPLETTYVPWEPQTLVQNWIVGIL